MEFDIAIVGAGAAGLAAAIFAAEAAPDRKIALLESAKRPGAKILISGGGRCNVTNARVTPDDFCGGPQPLIRSALRAFDEQRTVEWMQSLGVTLKTEPTGKLFPTTDKARTVLDALLQRLGELGVELITNTRVEDLKADESGFTLGTPGGPLRARRVILSTGGLSVPKTGSDGHGLAVAEALGHTCVPTTPALAPLVLAKGREGQPLTDLGGLTLDVRLALHGGDERKIAERVGSMVFTHFGLSGPAAMDLSRHLLRFRLEQPGAAHTVTLGHPTLTTPEAADAWLGEQQRAHPRRTITNMINALFPERLARHLAEDDATLMGQLARPRRRTLAERLARFPLPVLGDRGYNFAEATAGGVDLREVDIRTMASRRVPGLFLCGEMLDVDGRIGGFNFQWAWASGYLAGRGAARA